MVLSALLPTVNNSLHCRPRRGETRLKDISILCERQKRPVTTERNLLSKERSRNKNVFSAGMGEFMSIPTTN